MMRRQAMVRCALAVAVFLALALAAAVPSAEPMQLSYKPEKGLRIPYRIRAEGRVRIGPAKGERREVAIRLDARRVDVVTEAGGGRSVLQRTLESVEFRVGDEKQPVPEGLQATPRLYDVDSQGHVEPRGDTPWPAEVGPVFPEIMNLLETVPFGPGPVDVGDTWDASAPAEKQPPSGVQRRHSRSEGRLLDTYQSAGMEVGLIEQNVEADLRVTGSESSPSLNVTMSADVLQSNRIEDGALLGIRAKMREKLEYFRPDGRPALVMEITQLSASLEVAEDSQR
jgi:hypothetical protein